MLAFSGLQERHISVLGVLGLEFFYIVYRKNSIPRKPRTLILGSCNPQNANMSSSVLSYRACSDGKPFRDKENQVLGP